MENWQDYWRVSSKLRFPPDSLIFGGPIAIKGVATGFS